MNMYHINLPRHVSTSHGLIPGSIVFAGRNVGFLVKQNAPDPDLTGTPIRLLKGLPLKRSKKPDGLTLRVFCRTA